MLILMNLIYIGIHVLHNLWSFGSYKWSFLKLFLQRNEICHSFILFTFIFRWKVLCQLSFHPFLMRLVWLTWGTKIGKLAVQFWLTGLWKYHITFPTYSFLSSRQSCFNLRFWRKLVKNLFETISLSFFIVFYLFY